MSKILIFGFISFRPKFGPKSEENADLELVMSNLGILAKIGLPKVRRKIREQAI